MSRFLDITKEEEKWVIDNEDKYKNKTQMYNDFYNIYHKFTYIQFKGIRRKLVNLKSRAWTIEEKNFIIECLIDKELTYPEILPLYNKKFKKDKNIECLRNLGKKLKINVKSRRKTNFNYEAFEEKVVKKLYLTQFKNQCPVGTITKRNYKQLYIKIKMIPLEEFGKGNHGARNNTEYWYPYPKYVYEQYYGVKLKPNEYVFHIEGDYFNNNIENLICLKSNATITMKRLGLLDSTADLRKLGFKLCKLDELTKEEK